MQRLKNASVSALLAVIGGVAVIAAIGFGGAALFGAVSGDEGETETVELSSADTAAEPQAAVETDAATPVAATQPPRRSGDRSGARAGGTPAVIADDVGDAEFVDPDDVPLTEAERRKVADAAIAIVGAGTVTDIDRSDDVGEAYEVEVLTDVGEVDIALDDGLRRVPNLRYDD